MQLIPCKYIFNCINKRHWPISSSNASRGSVLSLPNLSFKKNLFFVMLLCYSLWSLSYLQASKWKYQCHDNIAESSAFQTTDLFLNGVNPICTERPTLKHKRDIGNGRFSLAQLKWGLSTAFHPSRARNCENRSNCNFPCLAKRGLWIKVSVAGNVTCPSGGGNLTINLKDLSVLTLDR